MVLGVVGEVSRKTQAHKDLEWFEPLERNILYPLFCIALERA
jgi:hypothetical protein